jgi:hypothetical protein
MSADRQNPKSIVEAPSKEDKRLIWDEKERHTRARRTEVHPTGAVPVLHPAISQSQRAVDLVAG